MKAFTITLIIDERNRINLTDKLLTMPRIGECLTLKDIKYRIIDIEYYIHEDKPILVGAQYSNEYSIYLHAKYI